MLSCVRTRPNAESELLTQLGINGSLPLPSLEEFVTGGLVALLASQTNLTSTALNALNSTTDSGSGEVGSGGAASSPALTALQTLGPLITSLIAPFA